MADELIEAYRFSLTGKIVKIHWVNGDARDAFDRLREPLGVFFYRGDSLGEGGSGITWNSFSLLLEVSDRLVDGGLIVTDGSNAHGCSESLIFGDDPFFMARRMPADSDWRQFIGLTSLATRSGRLTCIGYAGHRYGITLVWQLSKS